MGIDH